MLSSVSPHTHTQAAVKYMLLCCDVLLPRPLKNNNKACGRCYFLDTLCTHAATWYLSNEEKTQ